LLGSWTLDPVLLGTLMLAAALYGWGAARRGGRWPAWRTASFMAGLLVVALALLSGIDSYAQELLSVHVLEHLMLILLAPLLLACGAPVRLALGACPRGGRRVVAALLHGRAVRVLTRPSCAFALFTAVVLGTHLSGVYEAALRSPALHAAEHIAYLCSGLLLLVPLLAADPLPHPPGAIARFSWLMGAMLVMALPAGVFLFAGSVSYRSYLAPAHVLHISALADQRLAGVLMLVVGGALMGALAIALAMSAMRAEEMRQRRRESYLPARTAAGNPLVSVPAREPAGG
jgi:cytochrome c oxidase assembly factor CtaG